VLDLPADQVVRKGRLQPGKMFLVDTAQGRIVEDDEVKAELAAEHPYADWLHAGQLDLADLPRASTSCTATSRCCAASRCSATPRRSCASCSPRWPERRRADRLDGHRHPVAVLSEKPRLLFDYFSQLFAQVTNPPLDAIREELGHLAAGSIGPEQNLLEPSAASCRQIVLPFPVISNDELASILHINEDGDMPASPR
jgi:glutamate synthase (NADPH/NADH) large chain